MDKGLVHSSASGHIAMSAPEPASESLAVFAVQELSVFRGPHPGKLIIFHDRLCFEVEGQPVCQLLHAERSEKSQLHPGLFAVSAGHITIKTMTKRSFSLQSDALRAVQAWFGPPTPEDLRLALKRQLALITPIGSFFVLMSLPLGGLPFEPVLCAEGMILVFIGLLSRVSPHRVFFLIESIWFMVLAITTIGDVLKGVNKWWLLSVLIQIAVAIHGVREYLRFAPEKMVGDDNV
jgi:hypothetical protein